MSCGDRTVKLARRYAFLGRSMVVWLILIAAETINGAVREIFVEPVLGNKLAKEVSFASAIVLITLVGYLFIQWISAGDIRKLLQVGLFWSALTFAFEGFLTLTLADLTWEQFIMDLNPFSGGLMAYGLAYLIAVPVIAHYFSVAVSPAVLSRRISGLHR